MRTCPPAAGHLLDHVGCGAVCRRARLRRRDAVIACGAALGGRAAGQAEPAATREGERLDSRSQADTTAGRAPGGRRRQDAQDGAWRAGAGVRAADPGARGRGGAGDPGDEADAPTAGCRETWRRSSTAAAGATTTGADAGAGRAGRAYRSCPARAGAGPASSARVCRRRRDDGLPGTDPSGALAPRGDSRLGARDRPLGEHRPRLAPRGDARGPRRPHGARPPLRGRRGRPPARAAVVASWWRARTSPGGVLLRQAGGFRLTPPAAWY